MAIRDLARHAQDPLSICDVKPSKPCALREDDTKVWGNGVGLAGGATLVDPWPLQTMGGHASCCGKEVQMSNMASRSA
jgi:hypothetical protein